MQALNLFFGSRTRFLTTLGFVVLVIGIINPDLLVIAADRIGYAIARIIGPLVGPLVAIAIAFLAIKVILGNFRSKRR